MKSLKLQIDGMSCGHCLNAVNRALSGLPGVEVTTVNLGGAELTFDDHVITSGQIEAAVTEAGYRATSIVPVASTSARTDR